jgi:hypothetical protein
LWGGVGGGGPAPPTPLWEVEGPKAFHTCHDFQ